MCACVLSQVRPCDYLDSIQPGSSVHGIFQLVVIFYSKKSFRPRNWTPISCISCSLPLLPLQFYLEPISLDPLKLQIKKQRHYFANKGPSSQGYGFSHSHVWMWELDCEEIWLLKNWCFWTVLLEKTLEIPLDCKEIQPVHSKGDQPWVFFGRNDAKAETPVLWPPHAKSWLIGKDSDAGRDLGQEEKVMREDEIAGWHHRLDGREFEWTLGVGDGQGSLACCDSQGCKESDMTEQMNWTEMKLQILFGTS